MPDLRCVTRGDAEVAHHCSSGTCQAALPRSFTSQCGLGSLPQREASTCRLSHFFLFLLFLFSSHPPNKGVSRAGGDPALPFHFARGGRKWRRVGSADGRAWSAVMPLSCPGQVRSRVQLVPLIQCHSGCQEGANWQRSPAPFHHSTNWERICWCQWGCLGHPSVMVQGEHGQAVRSCS